MKTILLSKEFQCLDVNFSKYLNRRVFVMYYNSSNSKRSGKTAVMHWLAIVFAGRLCNKYPFVMYWSINQCQIPAFPATHTFVIVSPSQELTCIKFKCEVECLGP